MDEIIRRPPMASSPGNGVVRNDHFQVAYVTNDLARASKVFKDRYGIREFCPGGGQSPAGGQIDIQLAWAGGIMFELIQASGPGTDFYNERLPVAGFAIRHHHLGYLVKDETAWKALNQEIERDGWKVVFRGGLAGFMHAIYIDAPELGHFLEYIYPEADGISYFENVPVS